MDDRAINFEEFYNWYGKIQKTQKETDYIPSEEECRLLYDGLGIGGYPRNTSQPDAVFLATHEKAFKTYGGKSFGMIALEEKSKDEKSETVAIDINKGILLMRDGKGKWELFISEFGKKVELRDWKKHPTDLIWDKPDIKIAADSPKEFYAICCKMKQMPIEEILKQSEIKLTDEEKVQYGIIAPTQNINNNHKSEKLEEYKKLLEDLETLKRFRDAAYNNLTDEEKETLSNSETGKKR